MTSVDHLTGDELLAWFEGVIADAEARYPGAPTTVAYGDEPEQFTDWWGDPDAPCVLVSIHGGYFAAEYDRSVNEPMVRRLAHDGYLVANIEYQRAGTVSDAMHTVDDVRAAVAAAVERAAGRPVLVTGHSAGGYLCLAASTVPGVSAIIPLAPVTDLKGCDEGGWDEGEIARWIGQPRATDPSRWDRMELTSVGLGAVPCTVIHGRDDRVVPFAHSEAFVPSRPDARLVELGGTGHYEFLDPGSSAVDALVTAMIGSLSAAGAEGGTTGDKGATGDTRR